MTPKYFILPPTPINDSFILELNNKAFDLWESIWLETFGAKGFADKLTRDHFVKCHKLTLLTTETYEVIGVHLYTFMNFEAKVTPSLSFFKSIGENIPGELIARGLRSGICMEYLSVNPKFRKSTTGVPFGELLIGLGCKIMHEENIDCVFGTSREDVSVDKMANSFGGFIHKKGIRKFDYPCSLTVIENGAKSIEGYSKRDQLIQELWNDRTDMTKQRTAIASIKHAA